LAGKIIFGVLNGTLNPIYLSMSKICKIEA